VLPGAEDLGRIRHPLPREGDAPLRATCGHIQGHRLRARPAQRVREVGGGRDADARPGCAEHGS
jgi:hypothetical protein